MGEQTGVVRIQGSVGNLTFTKDNKVRLKTVRDTEEMKKSPRFKLMHQNWADFSQAAQAAKLLRRAFAKQLALFRDKRGHARTVTATLAIVKSDSTNPGGQKRMAKGNMGLLLKFQFNPKLSPDSKFWEQLNVEIDRVAGTASLTIPPLEVGRVIKPPYGATHFRLFAVTGVIDWGADKFETTNAETPHLIIGSYEHPEQVLDMTFAEASTGSIIMAFGISFFVLDNSGLMKEMVNDGANALGVVGVDHV